MKVRIALAAGVLVLAVTTAAVVGTASAGSSACPSSNSPNELVLVDGSGQTTQLGHAFAAPLQVQLANSNGCPLTGNLAGVNVDFDAPTSGPSGIFSGSGSGEASVGTDAQGTATAPTFTGNFTPGSYSVYAHSDYGAVVLYLANTANGLPAAISATGGSVQHAVVNGQYAQPVQAKVTDVNGNPVQGAEVSFSIEPGVTGASASFLGALPSATTDSNGLATSPPLLANGNPGSFTAIASTNGVTAIARYTLDNRAAVTTITAIKPWSLIATVSRIFRERMKTLVLDASGEPVEGASVTFAMNTTAGGPGASFPGGNAQATVLTNPSGIATSPAFTANTTWGRFTASAAVAGAAELATYALKNLAAAPATVAAGAGSSESTPIHTRFPVPLAVTVTDSYDNPVTGAVVVFAAPRRGASGTFMISGRRRQSHASRVVRVRTNARGIAVAPRFAANRNTGGYIVKAAVSGSNAHAAFALVNTARQ
jgi:hypothetical protein